jgi:hypothetical protein
MLAGATVSLFAVDLALAHRRWRSIAIDDALLLRPGGRLATLGLRGGPPAELAAGLLPLEARALFEALVEDQADASLHDAPFSALAEVCARLARAAKNRGLELAALEAAPLAYPAELQREPARETADGRAALVTWLEGPRLAHAARALAEIGDLGGARRGGELQGDLLDALRAVVAGPVVVGQILET